MVGWNIVGKVAGWIDWNKLVGSAGAAFVRQMQKRTAQLIATSSYTDAQVTQTVDTIKQLEKCSSMSSDLDPKFVGKICASMKNSDELKTRILIEKAKTNQARGWCIDALKAAVTIISTCGPTVIKEATFNLLGFD